MNMTKIDQNQIDEVLDRAVEDIIVRQDLEKKLQSGKILRVKHGVDPTTKDLHLGHAVAYWKMKQLQDMGHQIVFLIGDFTGRFGDPTEKLSDRKLRPKQEVKELAEKYLKQVGKILDLDKTEVRYNSDWYDKMSAEELLKLMSSFTVMRMLERDMFQQRIKRGLDIRLHDPVYPVLQGYDSVILKSDMTVCGSDQIFNELRGRDLQTEFKQKPQDILAVQLLPGTDGHQKMSQSLGNEIGLDDEPNEKYGKIMSIPDNLITVYFKLTTLVPLKEIDSIAKDLQSQSVNPRDIKARLAKEVVTLYHGQDEAKKAAKEFDQIFKDKGRPSKIEEKKVSSSNVLDVLVETKLASSKSEAKRLIEQGGIKIDNQIVKDWRKTITIKDNMIIQAGKRKFIKLKTN